METIEVKISDLKLAKYNPRKISAHDMGNLIASIQEFGFVEPVVVNKDNTVIGGHQRIRACEQIGIEKVSIVYVDLNKRKEKLLNLALNRIHGDWDEKKLYDVFLELDIKTPDFELAGFESFEVDKIFKDFGEEKEEDFDLEESLNRNKNPKSKRGEVYRLGRHRLMCGDATSREDVDKLMDGKKADMVFTDPPYQIETYNKFGYKGKARYGEGNPPPEFDQWIPLSIETLIEVLLNFLIYTSFKNGVILDCFGGNGSTLIACEKTNRICYMMEIDEVYCDVIRERYEKFTSE